LPLPRHLAAWGSAGRHASLSRRRGGARPGNLGGCPSNAPAAASDPGAASGVLAPPSCGVASATPPRSALRLPLSLPGSLVGYSDRLLGAGSRAARQRAGHRRLVHDLQRDAPLAREPPAVVDLGRDVDRPVGSVRDLHPYPPVGRVDASLLARQDDPAPGGVAETDGRRLGEDDGGEPV